MNGATTDKKASMTDPPPSVTAERPRRFISRLLAIAAVVGMSVAIYLNRETIAALSAWGYTGIFLTSLLSNATVIFPAPSLVLPFTMGAVLSPWGVALAAAAGAALGELTGYLAGYGGRAMVEDYETYRRVQHWLQGRTAAAIIALLAFLPLPLMDLAGIAAGALRMPLRRFLWWCFVGKLLKMLTVTTLGARLL